MYCNYCGSKAHEVEYCPKTASGSTNRIHLRCSYCGSNKHTVNACPKTYEGNANRAYNETSIEKDFIKD